MNTNPEEHPSRPATITWLSPDNKEHTELASPALLSRSIFVAPAIRIGNKYPRKRAYPGFNWFSKTNGFIWYESMFEREALLWLDLLTDVVAIASQPMRMDFADGSHHYPDFFALHSDHRQIVYDVKPASKLTQKALDQFKKTEDLCAEIGWSFQLITDQSDAARANINWLSNYRQTRFAPPAAARDGLITELTQGPLTVAEAAEILDLHSPDTGRPSVYHLIWQRDLTFDMQTVLTDSSSITRNQK
jgi:hypothetical protein